MRIAMFTNVFPPHVGGVAHSVQRFTQGIRKRRHRVLVVAPEYKGRPRDEEDVVRLPAIQNMTDMKVAFPLPLRDAVERAMEEVEPQVIHSHHPYMLGSMALRVAAQHLIPLVFTYHTRYEYYAHYVHPDSSAVQEFAARLGTGYCELADQVITPGESIRQLLQDRGVGTPIEPIPTGVDLEEYADGDGPAARDSFDIPRDAFLCGIVSRLAPEKNVSFLCRAVARYLARDEAAHFLVVGYGASTEAMKEILTERGVADRCCFAGKTTGQDLVNAYHAMDAFVFASKTETQGMVLVEALAAGCPVVALDAPGSREVVQDGENGRLIKEEDEEAFAEGLAWVAGQGGSLREPARASARPFSVDRCVERLLSLYERVIESGPDGPAGSGGTWDSLFRELQRDWDIWSNQVSALFDALNRADGAGRDD